MELDLIRVFVKVVQNGSFSKAAALLQLPKSTVSKSISRLEKTTGTKLLVRTTRSLTLTAAGRAFYDTSLGPVQILEDAQKSLYGQDSILSGQVRITAPEDLGLHVIAPTVAQLAATNPHLAFDLHYTDEVIDLVKDGFDLAIRIGRISESTFKIKRPGEVRLILVATPQYLKKIDKIKSPEDLKNCTCMSLKGGSLSVRWPLKSSKGGVIQVPIQARITSNQTNSLLKAALQHAGIALVPRFLCQKELHDGKLVRVLPEYSTPPLPVSMISPLNSTSSARLKITIDHIFSALQKALDPKDI